MSRERIVRYAFSNAVFKKREGWIVIRYRDFCDEFTVMNKLGLSRAELSQAGVKLGNF